MNGNFVTKAVALRKPSAGRPPDYGNHLVTQSACKCCGSKASGVKFTSGYPKKLMQRLMLSHAKKNLKAKELEQMGRLELMTYARDVLGVETRRVGANRKKTLWRPLPLVRDECKAKLAGLCQPKVPDVEDTAGPTVAGTNAGETTEQHSAKQCRAKSGARIEQKDPINANTEAPLMKKQRTTQTDSPRTIARKEASKLGIKHHGKLASELASRIADANTGQLTLQAWRRSTGPNASSKEPVALTQFRSLPDTPEKQLAPGSASALVKAKQPPEKSHVSLRTPTEKTAGNARLTTPTKKAAAHARKATPEAKRSTRKKAAAITADQGAE